MANLSVDRKIILKKLIIYALTIWYAFVNIATEVKFYKTLVISRPVLKQDSLNIITCSVELI
jgi:hypothetical protein